MEFLKTCSTNAQALGDIEAIAYQAFSITRNTGVPRSQPREWSQSEDVRAVEAELRLERHLIAQDSSRPWLWLFKPTTGDKSSQGDIELPDLEGYRFQRELAGFTKASELARPPMRAGNSHTSLNARNGQANNQGGAADQHQAPDCFMVYELFTSSVIALIAFFLVKDCNVVPLNYRTFISKPLLQLESHRAEAKDPTTLHWLTSVTVHWISSGTLLLSTFTERAHGLRSLDDISTDEEQQLVGTRIRVAPNALLGQISGFEDPLDMYMDATNQRTHRKKQKLGSLDQSIDKWKSNVKRWLEWKGYSLIGLERAASWVRIRTAHLPQLPLMGTNSAGSDREILWPRALCFLHHTALTTATTSDLHDYSLPNPSPNVLQWFESPGSVGFKDPVDIAQEWFSAKPNRDKVADAKRRAKKLEEDAVRRKEEPPGLYPSSPLNARSGTYGDLQAVGGVYPTPPDGIAPGPSLQTSDTPSVSGGAACNVILPPGGTNPAINLSAPQNHSQVDEQQQASTSPMFPPTTEDFHTSGFDDDLFEDMKEDETGGNGVDEADFDFFDEPDEVDVVMTEAPTLSQTKDETTIKSEETTAPVATAEPPEKAESDPLAALESALATPMHTVKHETQQVEKGKNTTITKTSLGQQADANITEEPTSSGHGELLRSKEPTPPLSPGLIAKTLQPASSVGARIRAPQMEIMANSPGNTFQPLGFGRRMSSVDAKYQDGRFASHHITGSDEDEIQARKGPAQVKSLRDLPLLNKLRLAVGVASRAKSHEALGLARNMDDDDEDDSDISSEMSDSSDKEVEDDLPSGPLTILGRLIIPSKRKLPTEGHRTPLSVTSFAESHGGDWQDLHGLQLDETALISFESSSWDWSLVRLPPPTERPLLGARYAMPSLPPPISQLPDTPTSQPDVNMDVPEGKQLGGKDSIAVTQIVTEQIVSATLDVLSEDPVEKGESASKPTVETPWQSVIKDLFPSAVECSITTLAAVHDVFPDLSAQTKGQQRPPPRKPNESSAIPANHIYPINPPFVRVRRSEIHWDLLPPSIAFWEPLGLSPVSPSKSVVTFCIYPHSSSLRSCLDTFLLNLQLAFDSCKLGSHVRADGIQGFEGGLVPWRATSSFSESDALQSLKDTCIQLGKLLAVHHAQIREQQDTKIDAFVIYMVDPFGNSSGLWELCSAFWTLFQTYGYAPSGRVDGHQKPDLVLQVVPMKYIASFDVPVILDPSAYVNLAREVYDRCPPSVPSADKTPLGIYKAPAFQLEEGLPRAIPFKLMSEPPQDLLRENSYMHLAYAISLDGTWLTAAWSDNCGKSQAVVSYHLGTRVFGEIAKEIWQTTIDILQSRKVHWRVCIAKCGVMEREELETWVLLITCPTQVNLFLTLLTVDTDPPYKFTPTGNAAANNNSGQPSAGTPESTPQAGVSPDTTMGLTPAATPSADTVADPSTDPEARLIDVTDETWGVILAHRLHNSNSTNQFSPALISGLLVKRGETFATSNSTYHLIPDPCSGPIVVAVNILWIGAVGSTRAATSPFPPATDGTSPGGYSAGGSAPPSPSPTQERSTSSLMWTPTVQTRTTAENLLKEVLGQFRALGLLAKLKGMRGTRHGSIPWHIVAAQRGVKGLEKVVGGL